MRAAASAGGQADPETWVHGLLFEDFELGQVFEHHWGRTLNEGDNSLFSTATLAFLPVHLNRSYARSQGHPDLVLNPMLVFCAVFGLSVEDLSEGRGGGAFLGVEGLEFAAPVYPGQTVTARSKVVDLRESQSRPGQGIVTWQTEGLDEEGRLVVSFRRTNLIWKREAER